MPEKLVDSYGWYASGQPRLSPEAYIRLVDEFRKTLNQLGVGIVGAIGVYLLYRRTKATEAQTWAIQETLKTTLASLELNREGQITDRFTKAIDHLGAVDKDGNKALEIRLGGIYALERIARDSADDHWRVIEVLCGYVRHNARWDEMSVSARVETGQSYVLPPTGFMVRQPDGSDNGHDPKDR